MTDLRHVALAVGVLGLSSVGPGWGEVPMGPAVAAKSSACFHTSSIGGWTYIDEHTVRVSVGPSRQFDLKLMGNAHDLNFKETLGIKASPSGWVCEGNGLGVEVFSRGPFHWRWPVTQVKLAPKASS